MNNLYSYLFKLSHKNMYTFYFGLIISNLVKDFKINIKYIQKNKGQNKKNSSKDRWQTHLFTS